MRPTTLGNRPQHNRTMAQFLVLVSAVMLISVPLFAQEGAYQQGRQAMNQGRTEEAIQDFCSLGGYKDAPQLCAQLRMQLENLNRANEANFQNGVRAFQQGNYEQARQYFDQVTGSRYNEAQQYLNSRIPAAMKGGAANRAPAVTPPAVSAPAATISFPKNSANPVVSKKAAEKVSPPPPPPIKEEAKSEISAPTTTAVSADAEAALRDSLRSFYAGNFSDAETKLQAYIDGGGGKRGMAQFYLGASKLSRFYLAGARNEDTALLMQARTAFRQASKVEGFVLPEQYVSPKIVELYRNSVQ
jgi:TolA-binding protein